MKKNQGITLIALVITIIVMLILVAVTITIAVNGGLFNYAREAAVKTNTRVNEEQEYANIESGKDYEYLIDKYTKTRKAKLYLMLPDGENYLEKNIIAENDMTWGEWLKKENYVNGAIAIINNYYEEYMPEFKNFEISINQNGEYEDVPEGAVVITRVNEGEKILLAGLKYDEFFSDDYVMEEDLIDFSAIYYLYEI